MRFLDINTAIGAAVVLLALPIDAKHDHNLQHIHALRKRHQHHNKPRTSSRIVAERDNGPCAFPTDAGLVAVTPGAMNKGWAMSPDQQCVPDSFCPYACPPGQVMAQWNPDAIKYPDPKSMDGGLYCNKQGEIIKMFPDKPYCVQGSNVVGAKNTCGKQVAFCQTVLPGNEAMIIPTEVDNWAQIAIPNADYWLSTAAHYYVNVPGYTTGDACIWGDGTKPLGNWAPYVAGGNTKADGSTYSMISWNPIYTGSWLAKTPPTFGIKIECLTGDCVGLPCSIDPTVNGVGGVTSDQVGTGADSVKFCVVSIPAGGKANIVTFPVGGSDDSEDVSAAADVASSLTPSKAPETTSQAAETTTSAPPTSSSVVQTSKSKPSQTASTLTTSEEETSSSVSAEASSSATFRPQILFELDRAGKNGTSTTTSRTAQGPTATKDTASTTPTDKKSSANAVSGSMFGLIVVFAAAIIIL